MKRKWFQIHLSTALVLMFAAGGLLWANLQAEDYDDVATLSSGYTYRGWPLSSYRIQWWGDPAQTIPEVPAEWSRGNLAIDLAAALGILAAVTLAFESQARRREKNREALRLKLGGEQ